MTQKLHTYVTTKRFTSGVMEGVTVTDTASYFSAPWQAGDRVDSPIMGGSPFIIVSCERID